MTQLKYVILSDGSNEYGLMFDPKLSHIDVAKGVMIESRFSEWSKILGELKPVSAGFVYLPERVIGREGSESLKLKPRAQDLDVLFKK